MTLDNRKRKIRAEISKAISKLKCGKSPGLDNISTNMLKCAQNELLPSIEKLFNSCLSSGNYPKNWAVGYITPIHKAGDISDHNHYRGISGTSALGKLFNSILDNRLDMFLENKCGHRNVLSKRQVWMSIFHIINFKIKKNSWTQGSWIF
jgi:hypothetical protein